MVRCIASSFAQSDIRGAQVKFDDEGIDLHFIHARSPNENAIPLLILHGWPGK